MSTFGVLQADIRDDLHRGDADLARIRKAIVNAIRHFRGKRFTWNQKRLDLPLVAGTEYYSLSADCLMVDYATVVDGADRYKLVALSNLELEEHQTDASYTGLPVWYSLARPRELRVHPVPDATYSLTMAYLYDLPEVSLSASDAATNGWMTDGRDMVFYRAMSELALAFLHGEEMAAASGRWLAMSREAERDALKVAAIGVATGRITPHL